MTIENPMIKLFEELRMAMDQHESATRQADIARGEQTDALNRLNKAQQAIDKAVDEARKNAPRDTDWKRERGMPVS